MFTKIKINAITVVIVTNHHHHRDLHLCQVNKQDKIHHNNHYHQCVQVQVKKTETNFAELSGDKLTVEQELLVPRGAGNVQGDANVFLCLF